MGSEDGLGPFPNQDGLGSVTKSLVLGMTLMKGAIVGGQECAVEVESGRAWIVVPRRIAVKEAVIADRRLAAKSLLERMITAGRPQGFGTAVVISCFKSRDSQNYELSVSSVDGKSFPIVDLSRSVFTVFKQECPRSHVTHQTQLRFSLSQIRLPPCSLRFVSLFDHGTSARDLRSTTRHL